MKETKYTYEVVGCAKIYIEDGMYSIAELEQKLDDEVDRAIAGVVR